MSPAPAPAPALCKAFADRIHALLAELRAAPPERWCKREGDTVSVSWQGTEEELTGRGFHLLTGAAMAATVERGAEDLAKATARDLELAVGMLVPCKLRAAVLADKRVIDRWPWSRQSDAGRELVLWTMGPCPDYPYDTRAKAADVAEWMAPVLRKHGHPATDEIVTVASEEGYLRSPVLAHPDTGEPWPWWAHSMADLFLARIRAGEAAARTRIVPVATVHPVVARATLWGAAATRMHRVNDALEIHGDGWRGSLPPVAAVAMAKEALGADLKSGGRIVGALVAWLACRVWERWQAGEDRFDYVPLAAGRNEMRAVLGADVTEDELDRALAWLMAARIGGLPVVAGVADEERSGERGGRPRKVRVVHVGAALAPMGLESVFHDAGKTMPPELRFYGFVLEPVHAPLTGDRRTHARQRDAFALFLGMHLTDRRMEYAERGGVAIVPAQWRAALKGMGIYHRSHQSLADAVLTAYLEPREGLWPRGPVLEETAPGSGIYRLGPDFQMQHAAILDKAEVSAVKRHGAREGKKRGARKLRVRNQNQ